MFCNLIVNIMNYRDNLRVVISVHLVASAKLSFLGLLFGSLLFLFLSDGIDWAHFIRKLISFAYLETCSEL